VSRQLTEELRTARDRVALVSRRLAAAGLVLGTAGNVSEQVGELIAITPTGAALKDLTADQITVIDRDGRVVDGELAPTSELDLHLGVYERYPAGAVVHTHAPVATAVSCVVDELPCIHYQMLLLGGTVRVAPYRTFGTPALAEVTLDALEDRMAALMANHGAIVWAQDLEHAFAQSELLEWACTVYWRAAAIGTPRALDDEDRTAVVAAATQRNYGTTHSIEQ
jgi:L-fuculose-phosphate aldolase